MSYLLIIGLSTIVSTLFTIVIHSIRKNKRKKQNIETLLLLKMKESFNFPVLAEKRHNDKELIKLDISKLEDLDNNLFVYFKIHKLSTNDDAFLKWFKRLCNTIPFSVFINRLENQDYETYMIFQRDILELYPEISHRLEVL